MASFKLYSWMLLVGVLGTIGTIVALNLLLASRNAHSERFLAASEWQERTHGITIALVHGTDTGPFKALRLNDRVADSNAIVFGSSTAMGMQGDMFTPPVRVYNFSQYANYLATIIGQVEYVLDHHEHVRWMFVPLEWSIGFLFFPGEISQLDLSRESVLQHIQAENRPLPWKTALKEALSYPQIMNLIRVMRTIINADDKSGAFRAIFLNRSGYEFLCDDGVARDFESETIRSNLYSSDSCFGFRYDGSAHFGVAPASARDIINTSLNTFVRVVLPMTKGQPQERYLSRLALLAHRLESRGGKMVFFMPPLFPGLEAQVLKRPDFGPYLERTKTALREWSENNRLQVLDFGQSENFGCTASEFFDGAHSRPNCYRKVLDATWRSYPDLLPSGPRFRDTEVTADASLR